jgi:SAM-dependent methyltransferase
MKSHFEKIYATNEWEFGSGEGSLPIHTTEYRAVLEKFMREHEIRRVVDFGCGDWQSSRLIDWSGIDYVGFDIVPAVIDANLRKYKKTNVDFRVFDEDFEHLPEADLLIIKDVLQHWSNAAIFRFLPTLQRYPYSLVTNCIAPWGRTVNIDMNDGGFRGLDIGAAPFNVESEEITVFTNHRSFFERLIPKPRWRKKVLLVRGDGCRKRASS